jgi:hypothetical protein
MSYQEVIWLSFISIMLAAGVLMIIEYLWRRKHRLDGVVIDKYTPGCFMRRTDVAQEWED